MKPLIGHDYPDGVHTFPARDWWVHDIFNCRCLCGPTPLEPPTRTGRVEWHHHALDPDTEGLTWLTIVP